MDALLGCRQWVQLNSLGSAPGTAVCYCQCASSLKSKTFGRTSICPAWEGWLWLVPGVWGWPGGQCLLWKLSGGPSCCMGSTQQTCFSLPAEQRNHKPQTQENLWESFSLSAVERLLIPEMQGIILALTLCTSHSLNISNTDSVVIW